MNELQSINNSLPSMSQDSIDKVSCLESYSANNLPQIDITTAHIIHAGMYARTILIPAGTMLTGVLVKCPTMLVVQGDVIVYIGEKSIELNGYNVLPAKANRKQAFYAKTDTHLTMIFATDAKTIQQAEDAFTDEVDLLGSRKNPASNQILITGE
jgi:hypothetical protein